MTNVLDPAALIALLPTLLPQAAASLTHPQDALTALIHAIMTALAFRLVGVDDSSPSRTFDGSVLPDAWNKAGPGSYTLRYRHDQSSLDFVVKTSKLGGRTLINAIAVESDKTATLDISTNDFTSPSFFPYVVGVTAATPLVHGFISSTRVTDFASQYVVKIVQNLLPGLRKEGYVEDSSTKSTSSAQPRHPDPGPARPRSPPDNPYGIDRMQAQVPPRSPLEIGRSDLDPFAGRNPFAPPPLFSPNAGDGMFVGPDHPIFGGGARGIGGDVRGPGGRGPWGGDGYLPPMGAPPGARFDPVGPFGRGGFGGRGRGPLPRGGYFTGDPDNDEFLPPGFNDMYS